MEAIEEGVVLHCGNACDQVVVTGEHLGGAVQRDVAAALERPQPQRRRERGVAHDGGRVRGSRLEVRHRQHRVRRRLEQDQVDARGRRSRLVVLDHLDPPGPDVVEQLLVPVVGALGEGDRAARRQHRQDDAGDCSHAGGEEQCAAALESAELGLDGDRVRLLGAGVRVSARLACRVVGPGGRAVEGSAHGSTLSTLTCRLHGRRLARWTRRPSSTRPRRGVPS